jgi:hypothetical protein
MITLNNSYTYTLKMPIVQSNLQRINCYGNLIIRIENLPSNLQYLDCHCNSK